MSLEFRIYFVCYYIIFTDRRDLIPVNYFEKHQKDDNVYVVKRPKINVRNTYFTYRLTSIYNYFIIIIFFFIYYL